MIDQMAYNYQAGTNKLNYIADPYHPTSVDIEGQSANNYTYDAIGNLTQDIKGGLSSIAWNPYGKITHISKGSNGNLYYDYDAMGNRIKKSFTQSNDNADKTWYVRDAQGNIMAIYSRKNYGTNQQLLLENYELYGSSRLGSLNYGIPVEGDYNLTATTNYTRSLGLKQYELSNHLGNVLTTFSDQRVLAPAGMSSTNSNALTPKLISAQDYYPFGMIMDGRSWNTDKYSFGFNGQEKDNEIYGDGNEYTTEFRQYDPRIGRWWSTDPVVHPYQTPYCSMDNNPILIRDDLGNDGRVSVNEKAGTITYQSTIWVFGENASEVANKSQENWDKMNENQKYKDENGKEWTIIMDVTFKASESLTNASNKWNSGDDKLEGNLEPKFQNGDNLMGIGMKAGEALGLSDDKRFGNSIPGVGYIFGSGNTNDFIHEVWHTLGFSDNRGSANDISRNSLASPKNVIEKFHYYELAERALICQKYLNKNYFVFTAYFDKFIDLENPTIVWGGNNQGRVKSKQELENEQNNKR